MIKLLKLSHVVLVLCVVLVYLLAKIAYLHFQLDAMHKAVLIDKAYKYYSGDDDNSLFVVAHKSHYKFKTTHCYLICMQTYS